MFFSSGVVSEESAFVLGPTPATNASCPVIAVILSERGESKDLRFAILLQGRESAVRPTAGGYRSATRSSKSKNSGKLIAADSAP